MVPMNLLDGNAVAAIAVTGSWSKKAAADGVHHGDLRVAWDGADEGYLRMPSVDEFDIPAGARYLHIC
jgi:phosphoserine aminotransferase